jgi:hypothetical protein
MRARPRQQADPAAGQFLHDGAFVRVGYLVRQHETFRRAPMIEFRWAHRHRHDCRPVRPTRRPCSNVSIATRKLRASRYRRQSVRDPDRPANRERPGTASDPGRSRRHIHLRVQVRVQDIRLETRPPRGKPDPGVLAAGAEARRAASRPDSPFCVCILLLTGEVLSVIQSTKRVRQAQLQSVTRRNGQLVGSLSCSDARMAAAIRRQSNASWCHKRAHPGSAVSAACCSRQSSARSRNRSPRSPATSIPPCIRSSPLQPGHESPVFLPPRSSAAVKFWTLGGPNDAAERVGASGQGGGE